MLFEIWCCVAEGCEDEDALLVADGFRGGVDAVEVDALDLAGVDLDGCVLVEYYGCLEVGVPVGLFCW